MTIIPGIKLRDVSDSHGLARVSCRVKTICECADPFSALNCRGLG